MDQTRAPAPRGPAVEVVRYALVSLGLGVASLLLLPFYGVTLVILPLPALVTTIKYGTRAGLAVAVAAAIPVTILAGPALGVPVLIATLALGVAQAAFTVRSVRASRIVTFCISVFLFLAAAGAALAFATKLVTLTGIERLSRQFQVEFAHYAGASAPQTAEAAKVFREIYVYLLPSGFIVLCLAAGLVSFLLSQRLLRGRDLPAVSLPAFKDWRVPWYLSWPFLFGLASVVGYRWLGPREGKIVLYAGLNLIVIFGSIYMVQGFSVLFFLFERWKLPPPARIALALAAGFLQVLVEALTWIGLFDTWFDFRKPRERGGGSPP